MNSLESEKSFNNQYYEMLMQSPFAVLVLKGEDMMIFLINNLGKELFEIEEDISGKKLIEVLPEIQDQQFLSLIKKVYATGVSNTAKESLVKIKRKDGELEDRYFDISLQPYREADSTISGVTSIIHEVTEIVHARRKKNESEHRYRTLIEESPVATALYTGPEICVQYANEIMMNFWGKDETVIGKPLIEAVPELVGQKFIQILKSVHTTGIPYYGVEEKAELLIDGKMQSFYFNFIYKALYDKVGNIYGIHHTATNVTEEVLSKKALKESEETLRQLLDIMPQKISQTDAKGKVTFFNQQWTNETGYSTNELMGNGWLKTINKEDYEDIKNNWLRAIKTGSFYEVECRILHKDLGYRWNLSRAVPITDENGNVIKWVATCTDIHEQKKQKTVLEKEVRERTKDLLLANNELLSANKELESFAYISSHDLQEPLRKIQTFSTRIRHKEAQNLSEKGLEYFVRMENSAERMRILIEDLLSFSRIKNTEKIYKRTDLKKLIDEAIEEYGEVIEKKKATIDVVASCEANVIPFQFLQLLKNLLSNALKFSKSDIPPNIIIKSEIRQGSEFNIKEISPKEDYCHLRIEDNGIGFNSDYSMRIFEVFQRLHSRDKYAGSGIGLAIVKKIVDNHQGLIKVKSKPDKGTCFDIYIPAKV